MDSSGLDYREIDALVEVVVRCHTTGYFVRDPSPQVLHRDPYGALEIPVNELEKRSHANVPHLSLAQLWSFMHGASTQRKLEAGRQYATRRGLNGVDLDGALKLYTDHRLERCFHENRDFKVIQVEGLRWHCRRELLRDSHSAIMQDPDRFLVPGPKLVKDGKSTTLGITPGDAVLKRFNLKKVSRLLKHQFAPSRARRAFQTAYHLESLGIQTPKPIAFSERKLVGTVYRSYLMMEFMDEVTEVDKAFRVWNEQGHPSKGRALRSVGRLVGLLHDAGFANRDLKAGNILVSAEGEASIIDLDGISHSDRVNEETRIKNLRRMVRDMPSFGHLTVRDRMTFLDSYAKTCRSGRAAALFRRLDEEPW